MHCFKFVLVRKLQMTIQIWFNWKFPITPPAVIYFILYIVNRGMYCGTTLLLWFSGTMFTLELLFPSVNPYMYFKITFCCKTFFLMTIYMPFPSRSPCLYSILSQWLHWNSLFQWDILYLSYDRYHLKKPCYNGCIQIFPPLYEFSCGIPSSFQIKWEQLHWYGLFCCGNKTFSQWLHWYTSLYYVFSCDISHHNNIIIPFITATYIGFLPVCHNVVF